MGSTSSNPQAPSTQSEGILLSQMGSIHEGPSELPLDKKIEGNSISTERGAWSVSDNSDLTSAPFIALRETAPAGESSDPNDDLRTAVIEVQASVFNSSDYMTGRGCDWSQDESGERTGASGGRRKLTRFFRPIRKMDRRQREISLSRLDRMVEGGGGWGWGWEDGEMALAI